MNQAKIGKFLQELRKEKGMTQEQLAEEVGVARRTVSRWETGSNLPDMDVLIELADLYAVDLRELLDGERREEKMDKDMEETVLKVAEYGNAEKERSTKVVQAFLMLGIVTLIVNLVMDIFEIGGSSATEFVKGLTYGITLGTLVLGFIYTTGMMTKIRAFKMRLIGKAPEN